MIQIYAADDHFSFITDHIEAEEHAHTMIQLTLAFEQDFELVIKGEEIQAKGIMIASNTPHVFKGKDQRQLFFLIDPTSIFGESLKKNYLQENAYTLIERELINQVVTKLKNMPLPMTTVEAYVNFFNFFHETFKLEIFQPTELKETIQHVINRIKTDSQEISTIENLAAEVHLSQSRLSHLFKENTGIALYSYLLMQKVKQTIALIFQGSSITDAAMAGGFDSPSHFAAVCKRMFGMATRSYSKDSVFLKVSTYP